MFKGGSQDIECRDKDVQEESCLNVHQGEAHDKQVDQRSKQVASGQPMTRESTYLTPYAASMRLPVKGGWQSTFLYKIYFYFHKSS
jgi:hypothetical protein